MTLSIFEKGSVPAVTIHYMDGNHGESMKIIYPCYNYNPYLISQGRPLLESRIDIEPVCNLVFDASLMWK